MKFSYRVLRRIVIYLVAAGCLVWVLHGVRFDELLGHLRGLHIGWIVPALVLDVLSTALHGVRWQLLLRTCGRLSVLRTTQAIYAGLFTNEILPMRAGEAVRGYLASRWTGLPFSKVLPSMITERVFDGSVLLLGMGVAAFFITLPREIANAGVIVGTAMLVVVAVMITIAFIHKTPPSAPESSKLKKPLQRVIAFLFGFAQGLRAIGTSPHFLPALVLSVLFLSLQVLSFWMVMKAYGLPVSLWVPATVFIIVRLGTAVPNAPANIGPYQFFCVVGLMLFGIEKTMATGFAIVLSIVFTIPLLTVGFIAFVKSGLTMSEVRRYATVPRR